MYRFVNSSTGTCRHVYDYCVVLQRDESIRSMTLPIDWYGVDEQTPPGAWVLLVTNIASAQSLPLSLIHI